MMPRKTNNNKDGKRPKLPARKDLKPVCTICDGELGKNSKVVGRRVKGCLYEFKTCGGGDCVAKATNSLMTIEDN